MFDNLNNRSSDNNDISFEFTRQRMQRVAEIVPERLRFFAQERIRGDFD